MPATTRAVTSQPLGAMLSPSSWSEGIGGDPETVVAGTNMIEQQFRVRIRNGRGAAMPGYSEEQISEEQLLLLYEWLKNP